MGEVGCRLLERNYRVNLCL